MARSEKEDNKEEEEKNMEEEDKEEASKYLNSTIMPLVVKMMLAFTFWQNTGASFKIESARSCFRTTFC